MGDDSEKPLLQIGSLPVAEVDVVEKFRRNDIRPRNLSDHRGRFCCVCLIWPGKIEKSLDIELSRD
jgi:hypothetical protein